MRLMLSEGLHKHALSVEASKENLGSHPLYLRNEELFSVEEVGNESRSSPFHVRQEELFSFEKTGNESSSLSPHFHDEDLLPFEKIGDEIRSFLVHSLHEVAFSHHDILISLVHIHRFDRAYTYRHPQS